MEHKNETLNRQKKYMAAVRKQQYKRNVKRGKSMKRDQYTPNAVTGPLFS
jgi:hypothetical protein